MECPRQENIGEMDDHSSNALFWRVVEPDEPRSSAVHRFAESLNFQWNDQQRSMNEQSISYLLTRHVKANEAKMVCTVQPKLSVSASLGHRITSVPLSPSGGASVVHRPKYSISFMTLVSRVADFKIVLVISGLFGTLQLWISKWNVGDVIYRSYL